MPLDSTASLPPPRGYRRGTVLVLDWLTRTFAPKYCAYFTERYGATSLTLIQRLERTKTMSINILPVDRALIIYGALANRSETKGARERLSEHLMKMYIEGEKDEHRLTVEGLSYLHNLNQEIDSRN